MDDRIGKAGELVPRHQPPARSRRANAAAVRASYGSRRIQAAQRFSEQQIAFILHQAEEGGTGEGQTLQPTFETAVDPHRLIDAIRLASQGRREVTPG